MLIAIQSFENYVQSPLAANKIINEITLFLTLHNIDPRTDVQSLT